MAHSTLSMLEVNPTKPAIGSVIWLHGLGADGNDFVPIVSELKLPEQLPLRFVFPHAPLRPVSINNGYVMRAWYDILSLQIDGNIDHAGIAKSAAQINDLIAHEQHMGIPTDKIILAGFSQGAVMALTAGLTYAKPLAGIVALSGYFPNAEQILSAHPDKQSLPIFLAHGTQDPIVPYFLGQQAHEALKKNHCAVTWKSYAIPHSVCAEEIGDLREWLEMVYRS